MKTVDKALLQTLQNMIDEAEAGTTPHRKAESGTVLPGNAEFDTTPHKVADKDNTKTGQRAFLRIVSLCQYSERCQTHIRDRLTREGFAPEAIEQGLTKACSQGIIDDERFAEALVAKRMAAGKGRAGIAAELDRLGIESDRALSECAFEDQEIDRALAMLERKPPKSQNKREGAYRRLIAKGFDSSTAQTAARLWSES